MKVFVPVLLVIVFGFTSCRKNSTNIQFDENINKKKFKIKMEVLGSEPLTTIYDREEWYPVPNGYGENEWYFSYKDSVKGYMRFIKTNGNDKHNYNFKVYQKDGRIMVDAAIEGVGGMTRTVVLNKNQNH